MRMPLVPTMREAVGSILVLGGVVIVVVQVLAIADSRLQMAVVAGGVMMIYLGTLRLKGQVRRGRRVYQQLRPEVNHVLGLVRQINAHVVATEGEQASETKAAMHESVDRIALVAGVMEGMTARPTA